jgi:energy-converting hydrogenase Eha subunit A
MKKITFTLIIFCVVGFVPHALAASNFVPLAGIPGLTQNVSATSAGLAVFFNNLYKYLIGLAAILAVIEIIWGGLEISTKDSVSKKSDGKQRIYNAILGLVLVLSPVVVFSIINPSILNLSLNLPALNTSNISTQTATTSVGQITTPTMNPGLTVLSVAFYGQVAIDGYLNDKTKNVVPNGASQLNTFTSQCTANGKKITIQLQTKTTCLSSYGITNTSGIVCAMYNVNCQ